MLHSISRTLVKQPRGAVSITCFLALALVVGTVQPPASAVVGVAGPEVKATAEAAADALALAQDTGGEIEIASATSSTARTIALPDGTLRTELSSVPVRTERADGEWVPINTDLVLRGDWWEPAASEYPVRFSAGGSNSLSEVTSAGGEAISETWPHGTLPAPTISGPTATYPEVLPGVDLKLTATELGMASVYVVKTPRAATNDLLTDLSVELEGADLTREDTGVITADLGEGTPIVASSPLWWDSSRGGTAEGPGDLAPAMPVDHELTNEGIALDVESTLGAVVPTYPVYIDPDWSSGAAAAWYTDGAYPNQSYLSAGASQDLRMGTYQQFHGDAFFEFNIGALAGKQVFSAQLSTTQTAIMAWPNSPAVVRTYGPRSVGFPWSQQDNNAWGPVLDTQSPGSWQGPPVTVGWNVTSGVQSRLGQSNVQFGISAENYRIQSRRHFSRNATLIVNYNSPPDAPTDMRIESPQRSCGTWGSPSPIGTTDVTVSVDQRDPDGGNVDTNFDLYRASGSSLDFVVNKHPGLLAQGRRSVTFSGLSEGVYAWSARGSDWNADSVGSSGWCFFSVDTAAPPAPSVSTTVKSFVVGGSVPVSLASTSDAAGYIYWLSYSAASSTPPPAPVSISRVNPLPDCYWREGGIRFACANGTSAVGITVAPVDALSTLWVAVYDKAGNVSPAAPLRLYAANGTRAARDPRINSGHAWLTTSMFDPLPTALPDSNTATPVTLNLPDATSKWQGTSEIRPNVTAPVLKISEPADPQIRITTSAVVNTTDSFSFGVWVRPTALTSRSVQVIAHQWSGSSGFSLSLQNGKLSLCRAGSVSAGENPAWTSNCVQSPTTIPANEWTLVTGVWDRVNQQLRLALGSSVTPVQVTPNVRGGSETWGQAGEFALGPPPTEWRFEGEVANPVIVPGVLDSRQLGSLAALQSPFTS